MRDYIIFCNFFKEVIKHDIFCSLKRLIVKYFSPDKLVQDYRITFLEILFQIDYNLSLIQNSEESVEFERLVAFFEFKN